MHTVKQFALRTEMAIVASDHVPRRSSLFLYIWRQFYSLRIERAHSAVSDKQVIFCRIRYYYFEIEIFLYGSI